MTPSHLLGIDWGSSNRRAYLIDRDGQVLSRHSDDRGMLAVRGNFPQALAELLALMQVDARVPVVMSGMVGSAQGWQEIPYLDTGVALSSLPRQLVRVAGTSADQRYLIVPGYCQRDASLGIDVMRGEETQLFGALAQGRGDGWVVLPGTHSKWVLLRGGAIERFSTFLTGELFAALSAGGTLAPLLAAGSDDDGDNAAAFSAGVSQARLQAPLTNALFGVRARVVSGAMPAGQAREFVSGLLIGTEFAAAASDRSHASVALIGSPALAERYRRAAALFDISIDTLDADALYIAALIRIFSEIA